MSYYVTHENSVLNINNAHLKVSGNVHTDVLKLGAMEFAPPASDVPGTVNFTNVTTGVTTTSNLNVGGTLMLGSVELVTSTSALEQTVNLGNTTSNTVQFTNATTGIVATGNVETQGKFIGDGSLLTGITTIESNVDLVRNTNNTAFINLNSNVVTEFPRSKKLIKYPRVVLTANGLNQGYTVSGSNEYSAGLTYYGAFTPPTSSNNPSGAWLTPTSGTTGYSTSTGEYLLSARLHSASLTGEYVQIVLPERINPVYFTVQPRPESANNNQGLLSCINEGEIWASDDSGTTWTPVGTIQNFTPTGLYQEYVVDNFNVSGYYDTFALIIHKNNGQVFAGVGEWKIFGSPEYDPEAYGTDVKITSHPNVPNTDWLDIYIDGQDYSTMPSGNDSVLDKSTNNRHGTPSNVTFNPTWKAFEIESASTSNITIPFNSTGGDYVHTIALWFLMDTTAGGNRCIFTIRGSESTGRQVALIINQDATSVGFKYDFYSSDVRHYDPSVVANKWMHVTLTYSGGDNTVDSKEIYLNGIKLDVTASGTSPLNLTGTENLIIGGNLNSGNASFEGMVANFRMFNRVLTPDEIYQLYAYQKEYFGHGDLSMTLKAGRLGIGTSEPRAVLDVRGDVRFSNVPHIYATDDGGYDGANNAYINFDRVESSYGIALVGTNGTFEITEQAGAGVYYVDGSVSYHQNNGTEVRNLELKIYLNGVSHHSNNRNYGLTAMKHVTSSTYSDLGVTALVKCNVGDTIRLYGKSNSSSINVHTPNNKMVIFKVQST